MHSSRAKNVVKYVVPTILSGVCFFLFTIVDGIFVGRGVGTNALGATSLISPFIMMVGAANMLVNVGGVSIFAIRIGKGDTEGANRIFRYGMAVLFVSSVVLSAAGVFFTDGICALFGVGETHYQYASEYLFWYSIFIIPSALFTGLQSYCRNDGAPGLVSVSVIISTAANIFGDWLLIFPIPWGMKGASIATGLAQTLGFLIMLTHFARGNGILRFGKPKSEPGMLRDILIHGLPEGVSQMATPVMTMCMNIVLMNKIGDLGVNAFSVIAYIASFSMAVFSGVGAGLQPLFGQSYGARNEGDLRFYFKSGLWISLLGSITLTGLGILMGVPICALFGADAVTTEYVLSVLPQFAVGFIVVAINIMICAYLYSTERSSQATVISLLRGIIVAALVILILPRLFGEPIIWYTLLIYEAVVLVVSIALLRGSEKNGIQFE